MRSQDGEDGAGSTAKTEVPNQNGNVYTNNPTQDKSCEEGPRSVANLEGLVLNDETNTLDNSGNVSSEYLNARYFSQVPCQYQPSLIQFNDNEEYTDYHFGLIRGYHREMYDENKQQKWYLCCSYDRETAKRITHRNSVLTWQIIGVVFGTVFVFFGLTSLLASVIISSDDTREYFLSSHEAPSATSLHILAIVGLTILTIGSALVSFCLLVPVCIGQMHLNDFAGFWCTAGDLYVKNADEKSYNVAPNQFLYFDAEHYRKIFGITQVKKIQPELKNTK